METLEIMLKNSLSVWKQLTNNRFVNNMKTDNLHNESLKSYLIQDYFYLMKYKEVLSISINKTDNKDIKALLNKYISQVTDFELKEHEKYINNHFDGINLASYQISDICEQYTSYMIEIAKNESIYYVLAALIVCAYSYEVIANSIKFDKLVCKMNDFCKMWVDAYSSISYHEENKVLFGLFNKITQDINQDEVSKLSKVFIKCSLYELEFFESFYKEEN